MLDYDYPIWKANLTEYITGYHLPSLTVEEFTFKSAFLSTTLKRQVISNFIIARHKSSTCGWAEFSTLVQELYKTFIKCHIRQLLFSCSEMKIKRIFTNKKKLLFYNVWNWCFLSFFQRFNSSPFSSASSPQCRCIQLGDKTGEYLARLVEGASHKVRNFMVNTRSLTYALSAILPLFYLYYRLTFFFRSHICPLPFLQGYVVLGSPLLLLFFFNSKIYCWWKIYRGLLPLHKLGTQYCPP